MDRKLIDLSPSFSLSFSLFLWLSTYISTDLSMFLSIYLSTYLSISLSLSLSTSVSTCLSASLKPKQFCTTSPILELNNVKNETILRDFFIFWTWQHPKRRDSARLLQFFELDNIKNKTILRDFLQKWKVEWSADSLVPMRFSIFLLHLSKVLQLPRKIDARSYEVLHLSRKIILTNLKIWCSKMQPLSGNQRPHLRTAPM